MMGNGATGAVYLKVMRVSHEISRDHTLNVCAANDSQLLPLEVADRS